MPIRVATSITTPADPYANPEKGLGRPAFITLELLIGNDRVEVLLRAHAYHRARSIADLWGRLFDRDAFERAPATERAASCSRTA